MKRAIVWAAIILMGLMPCHPALAGGVCGLGFGHKVAVVNHGYNYGLTHGYQKFAIQQQYHLVNPYVVEGAYIQKEAESLANKAIQRIVQGAVSEALQQALWKHGLQGPPGEEQQTTLVQQHCSKCHGDDKAQGGFALSQMDTADGREAALRAIMNPDESARMPRGTKIDDNTRGALVQEILGLQ